MSHFVLGQMKWANGHSLEVDSAKNQMSENPIHI